MTKKLPLSRSEQIANEFKAFRLAFRNVLFLIALGDEAQTKICYYIFRQFYFDMKPMFVKLERLHDEDAEFFQDFLVEWQKWRKALS